MFDINAVEKEALAEINREKADRAKGRIKAHLAKIATAEAVVVNLRNEYAVLLADVASA